MVLFNIVAFCLFCIRLVSCFNDQEPTGNNVTCWTKTVRMCRLPSESLKLISPPHPPGKNHCSPWMFYNGTSEKCECSEIPRRAVSCNDTLTVTSILDCYCMTYNSERNETELGRSLQGCRRQVYSTLPQSVFDLNSFSCGNVNKDSPLCGKCKPGYSPLVYSYDISCMNCTGMTYNWIKYIAVAYVPLTFFFFLVVVFRFSGTSPLMRGYITICQGIASPISIRSYLLFCKSKSSCDFVEKIISTVYGIWNLDFFRTVLPPICLNITPLQALALDYAIAFYPLLLVLVAYILIRLHSRDVRIVVWLWKPFRIVFCSKRREQDFEGSVAQAFATFFMLSYLKILTTTADLLVYTEKYTLPLGEKHYQVKRVLYFDPSVEYFGVDHLYYGIAAILIGIFIVILPLVFLVTYPMRWFQSCLNFFHFRRQTLDIFVNCYQGYYKDGTNGTRDCRFFSITYFSAQILILGSFTITKSICTYSAIAALLTVFMFTIFAIQPYKEQFRAYTVIDAFMLLVLSIVSCMIPAADEAEIKDDYFITPSYITVGVVIILPFFYLLGLIVWLFVVKWKLKQKLPCFRQKILTELSEQDSLPDRIENPSTYEPQAAPLLNVSQENQCHYGSSPTLP